MVVGREETVGSESSGTPGRSAAACQQPRTYQARKVEGLEGEWVWTHVRVRMSHSAATDCKYDHVYITA